MTANQIAYQNMMETKRSNVAREMETNRHNVVTEGETARHNVVTEGETQRHNIATENLGFGQLAESIRHNQANEAVGWGTLSVQRLQQQAQSQKWANDYAISKEQNRIKQQEADAKTDLVPYQQWEYGTKAAKNVADAMASASKSTSDAVGAVAQLMPMLIA